LQFGPELTAEGLTIMSLSNGRGAKNVSKPYPFDPLDMLGVALKNLKGDKLRE
jgi:hypothetical protein